MFSSGRGVWHSLSGTDALVAVNSQPSGISETEASARLAACGPNKLPETGRVGAVHIFLRQFTNPLIYLLLGAGGLSLIVGDRWDAIFIFGVLGMNAVIGSFQEFKADASTRALARLVPQFARVRRSGAAREVPSAEIVPGDIVELESGMNVTADLRLLSASGLRIDESMLTGESLPVTKNAQAEIDPVAVPGDRLTMAHAGTNVIGGRGLGVAVATGSATLLGEIGSTLASAARHAVDTPLIRRMAVLAREITGGALGLILVLSALLALQGEDARDIVLLAIALAVAAIPEGMPIAVTVALSAAARRLVKRNVIVRALPAVEGLGACTLIATDKTGTLTLNRLTVEQVVLPGSGAISRKEWLNGNISGQLTRLGRAAALCNEARLTDTGSPVGDAVDLALLDLAAETGNDPSGLLTAERLAIIPYEPDVRYAAVEAEVPEGSRIIVKGAPETVLAMCAGFDPSAHEIVERMAAEGYRVLVLAEGSPRPQDGRIIDHLKGLRLLGFVGLADPVRFGVVDAIAQCRRAGIAVRMITGDHPATALAIARQLGLPACPKSVITGVQLARLDPASEAFCHVVRCRVIFARIEPAQKLALVLALQRAQEIVAVTGDGVNDGPALRAADIGVAMGRSGTDVARGAADLVLADDNFATIVAGIEEGRVTFCNVRKIVLFMVATGLAEICMFLGALAAGLPMPLTPVQLLWLNLVTNGVQDVTLGFGKGEGDEMRQPPRRKLAPLLDREAVLLMLPGAGAMTVISVWMLAGHLEGGDTISEARNAVLLMVVLFQNAFLLSLRNLRRPFWRWRQPENGWLFLGMAAALTLQITAMYFPPMQHLLGVRPVSGRVVGECALGAIAVLLVTEMVKWGLNQGQLRKASDARAA